MRNVVLPIIKNREIWSGQMGVEGTDSARGYRSRSGGLVLYVDANHADASDAHDGTDPESPKLTIQGAISDTHLVDDSIIVVQPGTYTESLVITHDMAKRVTLYGGENRLAGPVLISAVATSPVITVAQFGWRFTGLYLRGPVSSSCIRLTEIVTDASDVSYLTLIDNNFFDGAWVGKWGVAFHGAPGDVHILDNTFKEFKQAGADALAIVVTNTSNADPYEAVIEGNKFYENNGHIGRACAGGWNVCTIKDNVFHTGALITCTTYVDTRGGSNGLNVVTGNLFPGDYSNTGGYYAHATDTWVGNFAADTGEAEVGDNGLTIAPPAA